MANRFDELAKVMAGDLSRRELLRRLGGGLAGTLLLSLGLGTRAVADDDDPGGSICPEFCKALRDDCPKTFDKKYRNLGQCVSECQHARNACRKDDGEFCPGAYCPNEHDGKKGKGKDDDEGKVVFDCCTHKEACKDRDKGLGGVCLEKPYK